MPTGSAEFIYFGDDPSHRSALIVSCRACAGRGSHQRLEAALGVRVQTWLSELGRYRYSAGRPLTPPTPLELLPAVRDAGQYAGPGVENGVGRGVGPDTGLDTGLHARLGPGPTTLRELLEVPCWISSRGKRLHSYRHRRRLYSWRHSHRDGVALVRYGGETTVRSTGEEVTIHPWATFLETRRLGRWAASGAGGPLPALCLAGDAATLSDLDWLVLDIDFKPEGRAMSHFGAGYRDRPLAAARAAGCPIFSSTSGNGAHILARLAASADRVDLGRSMTLPAAGDPALTGLTVDRFLPGAKALVCVRLERPMSDITPDVPVPVLSPNDLFSLLAAGRSSHPLG